MYLIIKNGNLYFNGHGCNIFNSNHKLVGTAKICNNMYKVNIETMDMYQFALLSVVSGSIWHRRMGHLNKKDLCKMRDGAVEGMKCTGEIQSSKSNCIVCNEISKADYLFQIVDQEPMIYCKLYRVSQR